MIGIQGKAIIPIVNQRGMIIGQNGIDFDRDSSAVLYLPVYPYSGATLFDRSGSSPPNNGTITGATLMRLNSGLWYLFFDGAGAADDLVTVTSSATIDKLWDAGGTAEAWIYPVSDGEGDDARIFDKRPAGDGWILNTRDQASGKVKLQFVIDWDTSDGSWKTTATCITLSTWSKVIVTYSSAATANDPIFYVGDATGLTTLTVGAGITEDSTPAGTRVDDSTKNLILGNNAATTKTYDGGQTLWRTQKSIKSAAQILNEFRWQKFLLGV